MIKNNKIARKKQEISGFEGSEGIKKKGPSSEDVAPYYSLD